MLDPDAIAPHTRCRVALDLNNTGLPELRRLLTALSDVDARTGPKQPLDFAYDEADPAAFDLLLSEGMVEIRYDVMLEDGISFTPDMLRLTCQGERLMLNLRSRIRAAARKGSESPARIAQRRMEN